MSELRIPTKAEAYEHLFKLLAASSPVWRTDEQEMEIIRARDMCDLAELRETIKAKP